MIDPEGYLFWSHGVVRVTTSSGITPLDGRNYYFEDLPAVDDELGQFYFTHDALLNPTIQLGESILPTTIHRQTPTESTGATIKRFMPI